MLQLTLGLLALSGLTAVLALLLEIAHAYLVNYGECRISINKGARDFSVQGGGKLLNALMDEGIFIPSACGGRGSCGLCKLRVIEGGGPLLPTETPYLDAKEIDEGVRLSCQVKVRGNLVIEIPSELFLIKAFRTRVVGLNDLTHNIREVHLQLIDPPQMDFKPGQFIQFEVPPYPGSPEPIYRAYSIASGIDTPTEIKLVITRVENGLATTYIHKLLQVGDEVSINGPYGDFYLRESNREIIFIATGSGLAPIVSILCQMVSEKNERKATLLYGVRNGKDLFYQKKLHRFERDLPNFTYFPILSAPLPEDHWEGETGRVTDIVEKVLTGGEEKEAYLCGNPFMIDAAVKILTRLGIPEDLIFYDKFA